MRMQIHWKLVQGGTVYVCFVAVKSGIATQNKVMSVAQTMVKLHETVLNKHFITQVEQFLEYSIFTPEYKYQQYSEGVGCPSVEMVMFYDLPGKTKVEYFKAMMVYYLKLLMKL